MSTTVSCNFTSFPAFKRGEDYDEHYVADDFFILSQELVDPLAFVPRVEHETMSTHCLFGCCECTNDCCKDVCCSVRQACQSEDLTIYALLEFVRSGYTLDWDSITVNPYLSVQELLGLSSILHLNQTLLTMRPDLTPQLIEMYRHARLPSGKSVFDWDILTHYLDSYL
jgi:hypothetical protein